MKAQGPKSKAWQAEEAKLGTIVRKVCALLPALKVEPAGVKARVKAGLTVHVVTLDIEPDYPGTVDAAAAALVSWVTDHKMTAYIRHDVPAYPAVQHAIRADLPKACVEIRQVYVLGKDRLSTTLTVYGR